MMLLPQLTLAADTAAPAVTIGDVTLRRDELFEAAGAVAARIHGAPAAAVHATASVDTVVAVVGCLQAGVPFVPVPPDAGVAERAHIIGDSKAAILLGPSGKPDPEIERIPVDRTERRTPIWSEGQSTDTAMIMYTSGTTGKPKGVVMSLGAMAAGLDGLATAWDWTGDDVVIHGLPLFHAHGLVLGLLGALRRGGSLVHTGRPSPANYAAAADKHPNAVVFAVPTIWSRLVADPATARHLASARLLVSGSAPLPVSVAAAVAELTGQMPVERYGMTETLIALAMRSAGERRPGWVGTPVPGVRTRIMENGAAVPADGETVGELQLQGPNLFDRYLGLPDATAQCFTEDGWFRTGDVAVVDDSGYHRIVGRESVDLIKTGGFKVGAGEVEAALLDHPDVIEAAVIGVEDADLGQRIVAYVVGDVAQSEILIEFVSHNLSRHKRPREIRVVNSLPRNAMGKVQKSALTQ